MAGSHGSRWQARVRAVLVAGGLMLALAACNTPSAGGPGLEPPGGGDSNDFANGAGEMIPTGNAGTGGGVPSMPTMDPGPKGPPSAASDAGTSTADASPLVPDVRTDAAQNDAGQNDAGVVCIWYTTSAPPKCAEGEVPIVDGASGRCVPIDACVCDGPEACPDSNHYTCHMFKMRCGPYL